MPDPKNPNNWGKVAIIINEVIQRGRTEEYGSAFKKVMEYGGKIVEVTYQYVDGILRVSDAWVK